MLATSSTAEAARVEGLSARFGLPHRAAENLTILAEMLARDARAPTTVRDQMRVLDDHIADSLVALELGALHSARLVADIGAGAGLPGLVLAIALPDADFALIESNARKVEFIRTAIAACGLGNVRAVHTRVESWTGGTSRFDIVTARAVARLDVVAEYAAPLLKIGGTLVAWRGRRDARAELQAQLAAARLGLEVTEPIRVFPYVGAEHRHLHSISKVSETPQQFPRRPGVAHKRPLGGGERPGGGSDARERASDRGRR